MHGLSLVVASGGYSSLWCTGFSLRSTGSRHAGFSRWRAGSVVVAHGLWSAGSVVVAHGLSCSAADVGSSQTRARTRVPCIGRRILNHCATREALHNFLKLKQPFNITKAVYVHGRNIRKYRSTKIRKYHGGRVSWGKVREWHGHIYTTRCKIDS